MKCASCGREVSGSSCPYCHFPVYEILGDNMEEAGAQIDALAKIHRSNYLDDMEIGVVLYKWKESDGNIVEDQSAPVYFAKGKDLKNGEVWYSETLARIPDVQTLTVRVVIKKGACQGHEDVEIRNLREAAFQRIGFRLEEALHVRLLLKNSYGLTESEPIAIAVG